MRITPTDPKTLRTEAEARLSDTPVTESLVHSNEKLLHELQVHQIQLEMQNEELRRMHLALEESHAGYVELYELAPVGYLTLTPNGLINKINLTATQLLGVNRNTLLSRRFAALITAKDSDKWYLFFSKVMKQNNRLSIELMLKGLSDTEIPVQLDCVCVNSMLRITMTDISKIKQAEALAIINAERTQAELVQKEALNQLQKIAGQLPGVVFQFRLRADGSSCFPYASDAFQNIFRLSPEEVNDDASKVFTLIHPDDYDGVITAMQKSDRDLSPWRYEYRIKFADGTVRWLLGNALLQREVDGSSLWHGFITDITESRQVAIALQESNRLLDLCMQLGHMGGWDFNLVDYTSNRTLEHDLIFGYQSLQQQWNYGIFLNHVFSEDRFEVNQLFQNAILTQTGVNFECRICRADGEMRWILVVGGPQPDDYGKVSSMYGIVQDITERKSLDQMLRDRNVDLEIAKSLAEEANLAKSTFLSRMSHELRTPLNAILGFAQLLEAGSPAPTPAQNVRVNEIIKAGWYLLNLINEILDLAGIESGKISLSQEPVSLIDLMLECQAMIEPKLQQRDIKLTFLPFDSSSFVYADRTRLKQVLINLLSNAIKYNREHGTIEVNFATITPERIRISIKDSGVGLPPEKLEQLFQPFNRLGQEHGAVEGTGIGLVVTKQLVELMGGSLGVDSTVGVGSEFWIELIRDDSFHSATGTVIQPLFIPQGHENAALFTLLYIEDNPANLMLVEHIIESHPHVQMLSARDGNAGIALARTHVPDVILIDINLPGISGTKAMQILHEDPATAHIPIIALSANAMPRDIEKGLEAGFFRYLTKPIKIDELMNALGDALEFSQTG